MKVFVVSDTHFPYHDEISLNKVFGLIKKEKPDAIVHTGDLIDQYVFSHYNRDVYITPGDDVEKGLALANEFWFKVKKAAPKARCYQVLGNHDMRIVKRIFDKLPELAHIFNLTNIYKFPGVQVSKSDRDILTLDGVVFVHGWLCNSFKHAQYFGKPVVHGHLHRPCIVAEGPKLWSMDVGHMADENSTPLSYMPTRFTRWRRACGIVEDGLPRLILL